MARAESRDNSKTPAQGVFVNAKWKIKGIAIIDFCTVNYGLSY